MKVKRIPNNTIEMVGETNNNSPEASQVEAVMEKKANKESLLVLKRVLKELYPNISSDAAVKVLDQVSAIQSKADLGDPLQYATVNYGGKRFVHFLPGSAILLGEDLKGTITKLAQKYRIPVPQVIAEAITFHSEWDQACTAGHVKPVYNEYGSRQKGLVIANVTEEAPEHVLNHMETLPTKEFFN